MPGHLGLGYTAAMRRAWRWAVGLGISALLCAALLRGTDAAAVRRQISGLRGPPVLAYAAALAGVQICRARRWRTLVSPFCPAGAHLAQRTSDVGTLMTMLLPLRLGELARPAMLEREAGAPFAATLAAVAVERVLDGLTVALLFFAAGAQVAWVAAPPALALAAEGALAFFLGLALFLAATWAARAEVARALAGAAARRLPGARAAARLFGAFVLGVGVLPDARAVVSIVAWTLAYWGVNALGLWALMAAFGWQRPLVDALLLVSTLSLGVMLPAGPGFLGTYQAALVLPLMALGVAGDAAMAYAWAAYALNLAVVLAFGLAHLSGPPAGGAGRWPLRRPRGSPPPPPG